MPESALLKKLGLSQGQGLGDSEVKDVEQPDAGPPPRLPTTFLPRLCSDGTMTWVSVVRLFAATASRRSRNL